MRKIPFPQANSINLMIEIIKDFDESGMTNFDVGKNCNIATREGSYYLDALYFLGIVEKFKVKYFLTKIGLELKYNNSKQVKLDICNVILNNTFFKDTLQLKFSEINNDIDDEFLVQNILSFTGLNLTTSKRRASTIKNWLKWISKNSGNFDE